MKKIHVLLFILIQTLALPLLAQSEVKRVLNHQEIEQLKNYSDSILLQLKKIYFKELKEKTPAKYQPQRIALVRDFLWLFEFFEEQYTVINLSKKNVIKIIGKADKIYQEDGFDVFDYNLQNNPHFKLKNFKYSFVFKNNILVSVKRYY